MKARNWLVTICFSLSVLLLVGGLTVAPPERVAAALQPQATVEPSPRYGHTMVTISDTVYLFGGTNITPTQGILSGPLHPAGDLLNDLWGYTDKDQDWKKIEPSGVVPSPRHSHAATTLAGLMYVYGGTDGTTVFNDMWEYNPATNQWTQKPWTGPYNAPNRYEGTLTGGGVGSDYLYLYGGRRPGGYISTTSYRYNVKTGEASSIPWDPGVRAGHSTVEYNGKIYLFGGIGGEPPRAQNDIWVFDARSDHPKWTKLEPRPDPAVGIPYGRAYANMVIYYDIITIFGGNNEELEFTDCWQLDLNRNEWRYHSSSANGSMFRRRSAAATLGGGTSGNMRTAQASSEAILIFGGLRNGVPIAETLIFQPLWRLYLPLVTR